MSCGEKYLSEPDFNPSILFIFEHQPEFMKNELFEALSVLHAKVADLKVYDYENATLLRRYSLEFEALSTRLLTFDPEKFKDVATDYQKSLPQGFHSEIDVHDDTDNGGGFYNSVENLNNSINDSIETINGL